MAEGIFRGPMELVDAEETRESLEQELATVMREKEVLAGREADLRKRLSAYVSPSIPVLLLGVPSLTKCDADRPKRIPFYLSLFRGRADIFARRSSKEGKKTSYYPVCGNVWTGKCPRTAGKKIRCVDCPSQRFIPLTGELLGTGNLGNTDPRGDGGIGLYPLLLDERCGFLAIDMDDTSWKEDALLLAGIARNAGFSMAIERSSSGNGAHLWLFFQDPIPAIKARELGKTFLTIACRESRTIRLSSYDRLFPSQDHLTKGGIGNLIMLPLHRGLASKGNTLFVDNDFNAYQDQWSFLSSLRRTTEGEVDAYLATHREGEGLSGLDDSLLDPLPVKTKYRLSKDKDVLAPVILYLSTGVSLDKRCFSARALDTFRRMASFPGPLTITKTSKYRKYQFICCAEENAHVLWLPRGCRSNVEKCLKDASIPYREESHVTGKKTPSMQFVGELREEQVPAYEAMKDHADGILAAGPSFGKTVIAARLIALRQLSTLVITTGDQLSVQWKESLGRFLSIKMKPQERKKGRKPKYDITNGIGIFDRRTGIVDVVNYQMLHPEKKEEDAWIPPAFLQEYGFVIVDECHHAAAATFRKILTVCKPKYVLGLSATVKRQDGMEPLVTFQCGPIRFRYGTDAIAFSRNMVLHLVPRFTPERKPLTIPDSSWTVPTMITMLSESPERNNHIVEDVKGSLQEGHIPLVLTHRIKHVELLSELLTREGVNAYSLHGKLDEKTKRKTMEKVRELKAGEGAIVAVGQYFGEGMDIPQVDVLFLTTPSSWEGIIVQYTGRILRQYPGKKDVWVYDYIDADIPLANSMYHKRLSAYRKNGFFSSLSEGWKGEKEQGVLFSQADAGKWLLDDLSTAHEVVFFSRSIRATSLTETIMTRLEDSSVRSVVVTSDRMYAFGKNVRKEYVREYGPDAVVIDQKIVWYGNRSFLYMEDEDDPSVGMLRLEDSSIAKAFLAGPNLSGTRELQGDLFG